MLDTASLPFECSERSIHRPVVPASVEERWQVMDSMLGRYLDGWAEADPVKIGNATAEDYVFYDPLVGRYSRQSLPQYFSLLRTRFTVDGVSRLQDLAFTLGDPMHGTCQGARRQYWREAPYLGLSGVSEIILTRRGIAAELVAYNLNMACETLLGRRGSGDCPTERSGRIK